MMIVTAGCKFDTALTLPVPKRADGCDHWHVAFQEQVGMEASKYHMTGNLFVPCGLCDHACGLPCLAIVALMTLEGFN